MHSIVLLRAALVPASVAVAGLSLRPAVTEPAVAEPLVELSGLECTDTDPALDADLSFRQHSVQAAESQDRTRRLSSVDATAVRAVEAATVAISNGLGAGGLAVGPQSALAARLAAVVSRAASSSSGSDMEPLSVRSSLSRLTAHSAASERLDAASSGSDSESQSEPEPEAVCASKRGWTSLGLRLAAAVGDARGTADCGPKDSWSSLGQRLSVAMNGCKQDAPSGPKDGWSSLGRRLATALDGSRSQVITEGTVPPLVGRVGRRSAPCVACIGKMPLHTDGFEADDERMRVEVHPRSQLSSRASRPRHSSNRRVAD